ncbi:MAG: hypothetical protein R2705_01745 [Ilumatobacteraceae bacterium]
MPPATARRDADRGGGLDRPRRLLRRRHPGLDLGNLLAHLWREEILGRRSPSLVADARDAVLRSYHADDLEGPSIPEHVRRSWELVSLARLACRDRHGSLGERDALRARFSEQLEHLLPLVDAHRS